MQPKLLLTGSAGRVGQLIRPRLGALGGALRLCDLRSAAPLRPWEEEIVGDLCAIADKAVEGCDTVIHLAGIATEDAFDPLIDANIRATYALYEAARKAGVRRILLASTNHVSGFYPASERVGPSLLPRPDSLYALSKLWCEGLARLYFDAHGIGSTVVRIGSVTESPETPRHRHTWFAPDDLVTLIQWVVATPEPRFDLFYGATPIGDGCFWTTEGQPDGWAPAATTRLDGLPEGDTGPWQGGGLADRFER
ncbi:NAD-dependent epimerase/dehydratase family protein [Roseobacter sinensis]|uniref:NAD(P)-dependent oxidoreductase n=1 Tax=Roseobacter sinensis TaxID=2931391 RepID=A0ABT3BFE1_9RHOB|nr:NAD(P)-dependent oxidoreductase [Roseobacter sp. WL0113]MCV3272295.1 NAD(P)-dependent oxidoreductase [Roseobacter sp. WL0113]